MSRQLVLDLIRKKDNIEQEIKQLGQLLESQRNVGLHQPLVDREGYPRLDVDVYQVRHARHRIICLQNDHKAIMEEIESSLHQLHAAESINGTEISCQAKNETRDSCGDNLTPFARVDNVMDNSPAQQAGLVAGDNIVKFGSVTADNFNNLQDIVRIVQHSVGKSLNLTILRNETLEQLTLIPNTWNGRGLLGCNLMPT